MPSRNCFLEPIWFWWTQVTGFFLKQLLCITNLAATLPSELCKAMGHFLIWGKLLFTTDLTRTGVCPVLKLIIPQKQSLIPISVKNCCIFFKVILCGVQNVWMFSSEAISQNFSCLGENLCPLEKAFFSCCFLKGLRL